MRYLSFISLLAVFFLSAEAQYIHEVLEYKPAPGQFINTQSLGSPHAARSIEGNITGAVSLGSFGGYLVFRFANPVENHPDNPYGIDFTIFGNALTQLSEPGIVSVMKDENRNGLPDDTWYELAGSEYFFDSTIKSYSVTYKNPGGEAAADVPWSDNQGNTGMVPANTVHTQRYYPLHDSFPGVSPDSYSLPGTRIEADVDFSQPGFVRSYPKTFGYADNHPRGDAPYTLPDNPYTPALENSGGDAFDISWAVDTMGEYVELEEIHFVKVHTAVLATIGWLGEISTEISGAVDVLPDKSISGETRSVVLKNLPDTLVGSRFKLEAHAFLMGRKQENEKIRWSVDKGDAEIDPENRLSFSVSGKVKITAALENEPSVSDSDSAVLVYKDPAALSPEGIPEPHVYPNPASDQLFLEYGRVASVSIHSVSGQPVSMFKTVPGRNTVDISGLEKGVYILRISADPSPVILRFIKN